MLRISLSNSIYCPARRVLRIGTQLPNQCALCHLFEAKGCNNLVDVGFFIHDGLQVDLPDRTDQALVVLLCGVAGAVELLQLLLEVGETRFEARTEPMHNREVSLIDAVHVSGDFGGHDLRGVVIPNVENMVRLELMSTDEPAL